MTNNSISCASVVDCSISIQHLPNRKRPILCVSFGSGEQIKVAEITDEQSLIKAAKVMFADAKRC